MARAGVNPPMTILKDMSSIDRVEVQRGAGSTLYGSGAIGGGQRNHGENLKKAFKPSFV